MAIILGVNMLYINLCLFKEISMASKGFKGTLYVCAVFQHLQLSVVVRTLVKKGSSARMQLCLEKPLTLSKPPACI